MKKILSANQLKAIAVIAMTADHLAWTFFPGYSEILFALLLHILGRIAAPIMWFFIAEGFFHTKSLKKYMARLLILSAVSHFAYNFCFGIPFVPFKTSVFNQTSVVWSLFWGLVLLSAAKSSKLNELYKYITLIFVCVIAFPADWSCVGSLSVLFIGMNRGDFKRQAAAIALLSAAYGLVYFVFLDRLYGIIQLFTCLSIPLLSLYSGHKGKLNGFGRFFYLYYPLHLVILGILRTSFLK